MLKKFNIADWYDLKGQVAIVTGGATGLGLAITRCLISAGAVVCVAARSEPEKVAGTLLPVRYYGHGEGAGAGGQNRRGTRNRGYFGEQCGKPL